MLFRNLDWSSDAMWKFNSKIEKMKIVWFKKWHAIETFIQKMTSCVKLCKKLTYFENLDSKSDAFLNTYFKTSYFSKVLIRKLFFLHFFRQMVVIEKMHSCKKWRFYWVKGPKVFLWKQNIHENQFVYKSISLQNLMRCKTFFFEMWHVQKFSIRKIPSCEKSALSLTRLNFLIVNMTRCTRNDSKTDYSQKN